MNIQRDTASTLNRNTVKDAVIFRLLCLFLLVLRAKNEEGAGFGQWDSFFLQLQISHRPRSGADGDFRLYLLIITYDEDEISAEAPENICLLVAIYIVDTKVVS